LALIRDYGTSNSYLVPYFEECSLMFLLGILVTLGDERHFNEVLPT